MSDELSKPALRRQLRARRDAFLSDLPAGAQDRLEAQAAAHLAPLLTGARCVAFYRAYAGEMDCAPALAATAAGGIATALPHVSGDGSAMRFLLWRPGEALVPGWRGLLQPSADALEASPDIIVAPLLGFDSALGRIGQGAGFYDRAFARLPRVKKIGLGWSIQICAGIASDPWDVALDAVVTEAGVIERA